MRNVVTREVEDCELREVTHLVRKAAGKSDQCEDLHSDETKHSKAQRD